MSVNEVHHREIASRLEYDKRKTGWMGVGLNADYPPLHLKKGDRLEPNLSCLDTEEFLSLDCTVAKRVLFWRTKDEKSVRHRNPLWSPNLGLEPSRCAALDWLHCLSLGTFQTWCSFAIHSLLRCDAWDTGDGEMKSRMILSFQRLSADVQDWQKAQQRAGREVTTVGVILSEQLGSATKPRFDFKGGQTNWMLEYLVLALLPRMFHRIGPSGGTVLSAGQKLLRMLQLIRENSVTFPIAAIQEFYESTRGYILDMNDLEVHEKPKDHMVVHMANRISFQGSPALYGNWLDESINKLLKSVAQGAHASNYARRILLEFPKAFSASQARSSEAKRRRLA